MSRHEKLITVYDAVLQSLNVYSDEDGALSRHVGNQQIPLTCDGLRVVMPTRAVLDRLDPKTQIGFHPLCESALRGESPIIRMLRTLINYRCTVVTLELMNQLLAIAMDASRHSLLSPEQKEFLKIVPDISTDCHKEFTDISKMIKPTEREKATNIYLKRAPTIRGAVFKRGGIVNFPLLDELRSKGDRVYGKYIKVRNKKILAALMGYILDDDGETRLAGVRMSYGSSNLTAPNFDALIHAYANIATRLQTVCDLFSNLPTYDLITTDLSWVSMLDDLSVFKGVIPTLPGNEGDISEHVNAPAPEQPQRASVLTRAAAPTQEETVRAIQPRRPLAAPLHGDAPPPIQSAAEEPVRRLAVEPLNTSSRIMNPTGSSTAVSDWAGRTPSYAGQSVVGRGVQRDQYQTPQVNRGFMSRGAPANNVQSSRFNESIAQAAPQLRRNDVLDMPLSNGRSVSMAVQHDAPPGRTVQNYGRTASTGNARRDTPFGV
jgi:hypothetical protein